MKICVTAADDLMSIQYVTILWNRASENNQAVQVSVAEVFGQCAASIIVCLSRIISLFDIPLNFQLCQEWPLFSVGWSTNNKTT